MHVELPKGQIRVNGSVDAESLRVADKTSIESQFWELQVEYYLNGKALLATQTLSFTVSRIPPEKYPDFRDFVNASLRAERQRLRVQKITP